MQSNKPKTIEELFAETDSGNHFYGIITESNGSKFFISKEVVSFKPWPIHERGKNLNTRYTYSLHGDLFIRQTTDESRNCSPAVELFNPHTKTYGAFANSDRVCAVEGQLIENKAVLVVRDWTANIQYLMGLARYDGCIEKIVVKGNNEDEQNEFIERVRNYYMRKYNLRG